MNDHERRTCCISPPEAIDRLLSLAHRAYQTVPFYAAHYASSFTATEAPILANLPILTKERARAAHDQMVSTAVQGAQHDVVIEYTSGSTGIPLKLVRTRLEILRAAKALWRCRTAFFAEAMSACGVQVSASAMLPQTSSSDPTILLNAFHLRPDRVDQYLDQLDQYRPAWLRGHPAILGILAEGLRRSNRRLTSRISFIESNSGWLSPETRAVLEDVFQCRVANHYGTREVYTIAYECSGGQMHILDDCVVAELLAAADTAHSDLLISSLIFEAMPFIRYRIGDVVSLEDKPCHCGRNSRTIRLLGGRSSEVIAGTALVGTYVFHVLVVRVIQAHAAILQYQVVQTALDQFEVSLVLEEPGQLDHIANRFRAEAASILPNARFSFQIVDHLETTAGGKISSFIKRM